MMRFNFLCVLLLILGFSQKLVAKTDVVEQTNPPMSAVAFYYSKMMDNSLQEIIELNWHSTKSNLYSFELSRELKSTTLLRRLLALVGATVEVNLNMTAAQQSGHGDYLQVNPYINMRWTHFPWNRYLLTGFAIGDGLSYSTKRPWVEQNTLTTQKNGTRFLNYLMFEFTLALPKHPNSQFLVRIHHRSGVFGLYCPGRIGSNAIGFGFRKRFASL